LEEIKDLEGISIEELIGSLQTHKQKINRRSNEKILEQALQLKLSLTKRRCKKRGASYQGQGQRPSRKGSKYSKSIGEGRGTKGFIREVHEQ
jgi:hypothetical protein